MGRLFVLGSLLAFGVAVLWAADDTTKAAKTRELLQTKITIEFKEARLEDALDEIKQMVPGLSFELGTKGGVSKNQTLNLKKMEGTVAEVLDALFKTKNLGYVVRSQKNSAYDGRITIKQGKERGYAAGEEPKDKDKVELKDKPEPKDKPAKDKKDKPAKDKPEPKDKDAAEPKDKTEPKDKDKPPEDDAEKAERLAKGKLRTAKELIEDGKKEKAKDICEEILKKYPKTKAAEEAKKLLEDLGGN